MSYRMSVLKDTPSHKWDKKTQNGDWSPRWQYWEYGGKNHRRLKK